MKLLVVDDSNIVRSRIARVVQSGVLGDVTLIGLARNGEEALRAAQHAAPDVVICGATPSNVSAAPVSP